MKLMNASTCQGRGDQPCGEKYFKPPHWKGLIPEACQKNVKIFVGRLRKPREIVDIDPTLPAPDHTHRWPTQMGRPLGPAWNSRTSPLSPCCAAVRGSGRCSASPSPPAPRTGVRRPCWPGTPEGPERTPRRGLGKTWWGKRCEKHWPAELAIQCRRVAACIDTEIQIEISLKTQLQIKKENPRKNKQ